VIPPGGRGKISLEVHLLGYKGDVKKTTTVKCNDSRTPQLQLVMRGTVRTLVDVLPGNTISFRGSAESLTTKTIDLVGGALPFHIRNIKTDLEGRVAHELETVEDGKKYRLKVSNLIQQGDYSGSLWLQTDLPQKPDVMIRITGAVEGEISVNPKTLFIGKMSPQQPVRSGSVLVIGNGGKPFKITNLNHDEKILAVTQHPLADKIGYRLEIAPKIENLTPGSRQQTVLTIETDLVPEGKNEVLIQLLNAQ
jgi:hypothetical protein